MGSTLMGVSKVSLDDATVFLMFFMFLVVKSVQLIAPALRQSNVQMNMAIDRRDVLKTAAAAGLALANAGVASAACDNAAKKCTTDQVNKNAAPVVSCSAMGDLPALTRTQITIFDHRGCAEHVNKEYTGAPSNDYNDEMLVKVQSVTLKRDDPKFLDMAKRVDMESKMTFHKSWQKGWAYDSDLNAGTLLPPVLLHRLFPPPSGATNVHGNEKAAKGNGLF
eukprot:641912-Hanusia_phi.AAC.1